MRENVLQCSFQAHCSVLLQAPVIFVNNLLILHYFNNYSAGRHKGEVRERKGFSAHYQEIAGKTSFCKNMNGKFVVKARKEMLFTEWRLLANC